MTTLNGSQARRYATYGRAAGIGILVCAGALWAVPLPGMKQLPSKPVPLAPPPSAEPVQTVATTKIDADAMDAISTRLDLAVVHAEHPKPAEEPKVVEVPPAESAGPEWTYLGPIHEAERTLAIIAVDGHQKVLAEGRTFGDTKLVSVAKDCINVEVKGVAKRIDRGQRSSSTVAWVRNLQNNTPPAKAGGAAQPGMAGNNLPPEVRARLAERGITPDQMQNWRNNNNNNRGGNGGGPGGGGRNRGMPGGGGVGANGDQRRGGDATQPVVVPLNVKPGTDSVKQVDGVSRSVN